MNQIPNDKEHCNPIGKHECPCLYNPVIGGTSCHLFKRTLPSSCYYKRLPECIKQKPKIIFKHEP